MQAADVISTAMQARNLIMNTWLGERLERVRGIEPLYAAWEAAVLPLNYTRGRWREPSAATIPTPA